MRRTRDRIGQHDRRWHRVARDGITVLAITAAGAAVVLAVAVKAGASTVQAIVEGDGSWYP